MIDISKITYRYYAVLSDGRQLNITDAVTSGGWNEGGGEISTRTTLTVANVKFDGKPLSSTIVPNTIIVIMADTGSGEKEVSRGYVVEWGPNRDSGGNSFTLTAYDELFNLQQSQDDRYITAGTGTKTAICAVFNDWGIPIGSYNGPNISHAKTLFKDQYLSDIILTLLDDAEKHGSAEYMVRMQAGKVYVSPIGSNTDIYHFDEDTSITVTRDKISTRSLVTRVKIMGLADDEGKRSVEATVDGQTKYGIRQRIYNRSSDDTLAAAKTAAQTIIDEQGQPERTTTLTAPDLPFLRKGDMVHVTTATLNGFYIIRSMEHDATNRKMTFTIEAYKAKATAEKTKEGGTEYIVNTPSGLNIRSGPGTDYKIIGGMEHGVSFFFDGQTSGMWMHGTGNGVTGWCYSSYLTKKAADVEYYVNTSFGLNIRSGPSTGYRVIGGMAYGESFFFDGQTSGMWMHGKGNGVTGWSYGSYLTKK